VAKEGEADVETEEEAFRLSVAVMDEAETRAGRMEKKTGEEVMGIREGAPTEGNSNGSCGATKAVKWRSAASGNEDREEEERLKKRCCCCT
jgi:hypothetical protein